MTGLIDIASMARRSVAPFLMSHIAIALPGVTLSDHSARGGTHTYRIGRAGKAGFSIERRGIFAARGEADRVGGWISVSDEDGAVTGLALSVDPASAALQWTDIVAERRQVQGLPRMHFQSSALPSRHDRWTLRGLLHIADTPRLQVLDVVLREKVRDSITGTEIASYELNGQVDLTQFAAQDDDTLLGGSATLTIRIDVEISPGE